MKTRSQTKPIELTAPNFVKYEVDIDFDGASEAWKANKKVLEMVVINMCVKKLV